MNTERRQCLQWLGSLLGGLIIAGCGGAIQQPAKIQATIILENSRSKTVNIPIGSTVIAAIAAAYSLQLGETTIIGGLAGHWQYSINGSTPTIYAGDCILDTDSTIELRRF